MQLELLHLSCNKFQKQYQRGKCHISHIKKSGIKIPRADISKKVFNGRQTIFSSSSILFDKLVIKKKLPKYKFLIGAQVQKSLIAVNYYITGDSSTSNKTMQR